jgi:hypothetical protein
LCNYFKDVKAHSDADLLVLPTDAAVFEDAGFRWVLVQLLHHIVTILILHGFTPQGALLIASNA